MANNTPPMGAPKAAEIPAAVPADTNSRWSAGSERAGIPGSLPAVSWQAAEVCCSAADVVRGRIASQAELQLLHGKQHAGSQGLQTDTGCASETGYLSR